MPNLPDKDACELLDADHIAVKYLFVEYARLAMAAPNESVEERTQFAARICEELTVHATIEEEIFYPALRKASPEAAKLLDEAQAEHQEAKEFISQIQALATASPEMDELVAQLACAIEHHVKEERDHLFPKAKSAKKLDLVALGEQLRERQQALQATVTA
jgi:iron-sulfur cluster repair protein YtfE (RIC family)